MTSNLKTAIHHHSTECLLPCLLVQCVEDAHGGQENVGKTATHFIFLAPKGAHPLLHRLFRDQWQQVQLLHHLNSGKWDDS